MSTNPAEQPGRAVHYAAAVTLDGRLVSPATLGHISEVADAAARTAGMKYAQEAATAAATAAANAAVNALDDTVRDVIDRMEAGEFVGEKGDAGADWSKDQQAKVQGYWIVVSPTEPASATYTTADGTVVPVIWQKPLAVQVPVLPTEPLRGPFDYSATVRPLVGVEYLAGGQVLAPGAAQKLGGPGKKVTVTARALPGYTLPHDFSWTYTWPDPNARTLHVSDAFSGEDGALVGRVPDLYAGGVAQPWGHTSGFWRTSAGVLVPAGKSDTSHTGAGFDMTTPYTRVEFSLSGAQVGTASPRITFARSGTNVAGGISFHMRPDGSADFMLVLAPTGSETHVARVKGTPWVAGEYAVEFNGSQLVFEAPGSPKFVKEVSTPIDSIRSKGNWTTLGVLNTTTYDWALDNVRFYKVGA